MILIVAIIVILVGLLLLWASKRMDERQSNPDDYNAFFVMVFAWVAIIIGFCALVGRIAWLVGIQDGLF